MVALLALVVIFESNSPTGEFVAVKGNTNTMTFKGTPDIRPSCPESDINCHRIDCRSQEGDDNFHLCGKCPKGSPADPKGLTGKCCLPTSGDYHCETFREYMWYSSKQSLATLCSPTQGVCWT